MPSDLKTGLGQFLTPGTEGGHFHRGEESRGGKMAHASYPQRVSAPPPPGMVPQSQVFCVYNWTVPGLDE